MVGGAAVTRRAARCSRGVSDDSSEAAVERALATLEPIEAADRRRALVIVNPYATAVSDRLRNLVVHALAARYEVEAVETRRAATRPRSRAQAAGDGYDVVIAFGGDGTVNEAANGLAGLRHAAERPARRLRERVLQAARHSRRDRRRHPAPAGVADDFAPRRIDLGEVEGRLYTFSAGHRHRRRRRARRRREAAR